MTCDMTEYCYSIIGIKLTEEVNKQIDNNIIYAKNMKYWLPISKEIFWELLKFPSHINENDVLFHPRLWNISTDMLIDMIIYYGIFICENAVLKYLQIEVTYNLEYLRIILDLSFLIFLILIMYIVYIYPIDEYILIQIALFMRGQKLTFCFTLYET